MNELSWLSLALTIVGALTVGRWCAGQWLALALLIDEWSKTRATNMVGAAIMDYEWDRTGERTLAIEYALFIMTGIRLHIDEDDA